MSTNYNRRRGAKANKPRRPRPCLHEQYDYNEGIAVSAYVCGAVVNPGTNGNKCEEHRAR